MRRWQIVIRHEDKVDVIIPFNSGHRESQILIPHEEKVDVIIPINVLFRGGGELWSLMKIKLMLFPQSTYSSVMSQSWVWANVKVADNMFNIYISVINSSLYLVDVPLKCAKSPTKQTRLYTPSVNLSLSLDHEVDTPGIFSTPVTLSGPRFLLVDFPMGQCTNWVTQQIQDSDFQTNLDQFRPIQKAKNMQLNQSLLLWFHPYNMGF